MAVRATNVALGHFSSHTVERSAFVPDRSDSEKLVHALAVIKLQHYRISLSTIDTWVIHQILNYPVPDDRLLAGVVFTRLVHVVLLVPLIMTF
jgi:hypothetical protein